MKISSLYACRPYTQDCDSEINILNIVANSMKNHTNNNLMCGARNNQATKTSG